MSDVWTTAGVNMTVILPELVLFGFAISSSLLTVANAVLFRRIINAVVKHSTVSLQD